MGGGHIRYVDDFVILDASKEKLECYKASINEFLKTIMLELHSQKSKIMPLHRGITFLGFRIFYHHKLLKKSNVRQIKHRIENFIDSYEQGIMNKYEVLERIEGWKAYAMHGNTYRLRKRMAAKLKRMI